MNQETRIRELVDQLLESQATPEEVCRSAGALELLPQVRARWRKVCRVRGELDALFPAVPGQGSPPPPAPAPPQIPGYEVQGELGRGGMGVVYRAWHLRLNRPVALKMLLAGPYARPEELERFQREAQAVAGLRHPNIVQVYDAGEYDGRPYFTMELVEGGSLAEHIKGVPQPPRQAAALVAALADAVHAAHQRGIVHRDLKPGNVLLTADGTPEVADFGLARRLEGDGGLTQSGVPLGTASYMSPCQARGDRDVGPATDIWSLGAILYELLTGRPPFHGESPMQTLQQVLTMEPVPPARLSPSVPRDLETICLKCLNKEPHRRYASAQALADDLRRFGRGEPITARPLGRLARLARWTRRRPSAAALAGVLVVTFLLALALAGVALWLHGERQATARAAEEDLREADELLRESDLPAARAALERARGTLGADGPAEIRRRLGRVEAALKLHQRLDDIRLGRSTLLDKYYNVDVAQPDRDYEEAFRSAGLGTDQEAEAVAARVRDSPDRKALVAALDDWAGCTPNERRRAWLLQAARLADPDPWRDQARDPAPQAWADRARLAELARTAPVEQESVQLLVVLADRLSGAGGQAEAVTFLRRVQQAHPADYYANNSLGSALLHVRKSGDAVGYFRAALAVRPRSTAAWDNLGYALLRVRRFDEARAAFEEVLRIDPDYHLAHAGIGMVLSRMGQTDQAIDRLKLAVALVPTASTVHSELAHALQRRQRWSEAITHFRAAVAREPNSPWLRYDLGMALNSPGHQDEAIEHLRKVLALDPSYPSARTNLGRILLDRGRAVEAVAELRQAVGREPRDAVARALLRKALTCLGQWPEVRAAWRQELDSGPREHDAWLGYAELCLFLGEEEEYCRARRELLSRFGSATDPQVAERTARACLLLPGSEDELRQAVALSERALSADRAKLAFAYPYFVFVRGLADYRRARWKEALAAMRGEAARTAEYLGPGSSLVAAMALHQLGQKEEARKTLAGAVSTHDWSPARADTHDAWIVHVLRREAEALILPGLPAFLKGSCEPRDNDERLALLGACQFQGRRAAMAGLYAEAFAADASLAEDLEAGHRFNAARAAAVAGTGGGADGAKLSDSERARWRRQALRWLGQDLAARAKRLDGTKPAERAEMLKALGRWREEPDLAGLRDPAALQRLPPAERQECEALWSKLSARLVPTPPPG